MNKRKQNEKERTFLSGCKALFSIKWDLTTFNLLMNQFHSLKKISYSGYCRVRSDSSSLIALGLLGLLGRDIPDVSYIVAKLTTFCLGRSPQIICPVLRKKWTLMNGIYMTYKQQLIRIWAHIWMEQGIVLLKLFCIFFSFGKDIAQINFFSTKRCLASEDT